MLHGGSQNKDFAVKWYFTHTSNSTEYLQRGVVDVAITYHAVTELTARAWRGSSTLAGPLDACW